MAHYQVNMRAVLGNAKLARFHMDFETPAVLTQVSMQSMANAAVGAWNDAATRALFAADVTLGQTEIFQFERLDNCPGSAASVFVCPNGKTRYVRRPVTPVTFSATGGVVGTAAGTSLPPQNAIVCSFRTGSAGRRFFGRAYLPPPPEGESDGTGIVSVAYATAVRDRVTAIAVAVEGSIIPIDVDHIVYSVRFDQMAEVLTYTVFRGIDTQRRRRVRPTT